MQRRRGDLHADEFVMIGIHFLKDVLGILRSAKLLVRNPGGRVRLRALLDLVTHAVHIMQTSIELDRVDEAVLVRVEPHKHRL